MLNRLLLVTWLALCPLLAQAQNEPPIRAERLAPGETLKLTGRLDHPAWQRAPVYERFVEQAPRRGVPPTERTQVKVLVDDRAIWVGVTAFDRDPSRIRRPPVRFDQVNRTQDFIVVHLDPIGSRRSAQWFRLSAAGSMADGLHTAADDFEDFAPDFDWDGAVAPHPEGWTAVFRLPFASLRFSEDGGNDWRIMVARRLPRDDFHLFTSVLIPPEAGSFIGALQPLEGVRLPDRHAFLTLRPSLTLRRTHEAPANAPRRNDHDIDASLDVKWRPRAELVIDGTLNPDFSQVALDVPQLAGNTRFALSLAEKRPFFFESADLLRTPTEAIYTRSFTAPRGGLRATWRGARLAGSAIAVDDRGGGTVLLPGAYGTDVAEQPASRTLASRAKLDLGSVQLGGVLASRRYADDRGDNTVVGPDVGVTLPGDWRVRAQWLHARTTARPDGHGALVRGAADDGDRLTLKVNRNVDLGETTLTLEDIGRGFRHDTGFLAQNDVRKLHVFHSGGWRGVGPLHELWLNVTALRTETRGQGQVVEQAVFPGVYVTGSRNLEWWAEWHAGARVRATPTGPLMSQNYLASGLVVSPAPWFPLLDTKLDIGRLADMQAERVRPGLRWITTARLRPLQRLELEPSWSWSWLRDDGRRVYDERVLSLLAVWHLDSRSHVRLIAQRAEFERDGQRLAQGQDLSLTWSWRASAGTVVYVGASRSQQGIALRSRTTEAFFKLQLDADDVSSWWRS